MSQFVYCSLARKKNTTQLGKFGLYHTPLALDKLVSVSSKIGSQCPGAGISDSDICLVLMLGAAPVRNR